MSVFVRLEKKKFGDDKARGKWYAKVVRTGEVGIDELAERIQDVSTFKRGEVRGILIELLEQMKSCLAEGQTVRAVPSLGGERAGGESGEVPHRLEREACEVQVPARRLSSEGRMHRPATG